MGKKYGILKLTVNATDNDPDLPASYQLHQLLV